MKFTILSIYSLVLFNLLLFIQVNNCISISLQFFHIKMPFDIFFNKNNTISQFIDYAINSIQYQSIKFYRETMKDIQEKQTKFQAFEDKMQSSLFPSKSITCHIEKSEYDVLIEEALALARSYQDIENWDYLGHDQDIIVWRNDKVQCLSNKEHSRWPCFKSFTTINVPIESLTELLLDSNKVHLFNQYSAGRSDVEIISPLSKIVWNRTKVPLAMKPYDFCSLIHVFKDKNNERTLIISKGTNHIKAPLTKDFSRSEIIFSMNILTPSKSDKSKTDFTTINHVRYAGTMPYLASKTGFQGTVNYLKQLKTMSPIVALKPNQKD